MFDKIGFDDGKGFIKLLLSIYDVIIKTIINIGLVQEHDDE